MHAPTLLLCRIGWHAASPDGVWNGGYCFTRCRRCGRDMVRSVFGEWHVPKGFRVVWRDIAPPPATPRPAKAEPAPDDAAPEQRPRPTVTDDLPRVERSPFDFSEFDEVDGAGPTTDWRSVPSPPRESTRSHR